MRCVAVGFHSKGELERYVLSLVVSTHIQNLGILPHVTGLACYADLSYGVIKVRGVCFPSTLAPCTADGGWGAEKIEETFCGYRF